MFPLPPASVQRTTCPAWGPSVTTFPTRTCPLTGIPRIGPPVGRTYPFNAFRCAGVLADHACHPSATDGGLSSAFVSMIFTGVVASALPTRSETVARATQVDR